MNIIIYKINSIKTPDICFYISKNNKKPIHNKSYIAVFSHYVGGINRYYVYLEYCLAIKCKALTKYNRLIYKINIDDINARHLSILNDTENVSLQRILSSCNGIPSGIYNLLNLGLYN